ncbi:MAG: hypothetical protein V1799_13650 [bacterium]
MINLTFRCLMFTALVLIIVMNSFAQITIAPTLVMMSDKNPYGIFFVANETTTAQEVTVTFRFGYPTSDTLGNGYMQYVDSLAERQYSINTWIRAFPQRFVVQPNQRQMIRIVARPPRQIQPGLYWTRIIVGSQPASTRIDTLTAGISTQITFRLEQITTAAYKRGTVQTELSLGDFQVLQDTGAVHILVPIKRLQNSPFYGTISLRVLDSTGKVVAEDFEVSSVYFNYTKRFSIPRGKFVGKEFEAELKIISERSDIPKQDVPQIAPLTKKIKFTLQ